MARDATEVRDYSSGYVFRAPLGTTLPATIDAIMALVETPGLWTNVGYISDDAVELAINREVEEVKAWADHAVVRTRQTGFGSTFKFATLQTNTTSAEMVQGSSTAIAATVPGHYAWCLLGYDGADNAIGWTIADGQAWEPEPMNLGKELAWGVTVTTYPDANGNNANGPYIDDDVVS